MKQHRLAVAALVALSSLPAAAKDNIIEDPAITQKRLSNSLHGSFVINGQRVECSYQSETVPGASFLSVFRHFPEFVAVSNYRYLGQEGNTIRFAFERSLERTAPDGKRSVELQGNYVVSYVARDDAKFILIPEELQYAGIRFELNAVPDRGVIVSSLVRIPGPK